MDFEVDPRNDLHLQEASPLGVLCGGTRIIYTSFIRRMFLRDTTAQRCPSCLAYAEALEQNTITPDEILERRAVMQQAIELA